MNAKVRSREEVVEILRSRGVTLTRQRIEIAHALFSRCEHLSADGILATVNDRACETSKATVYNTLNLFVKRQLVRELIVDPDRVFYDPNTEPHHHFYNVDTGELTDIPLESVSLTVGTALPAGTEQAGVDVVVRVRGCRAD
jgi:Fur family iron response transcriptional regulator